MPVKKVWEFTVKGRAEFAFDMLRYDACWPASQNDVAEMAPHYRSSKYSEVRQVTLKSEHGPPTEGRWASFGWPVAEVRERRL